MTNNKNTKPRILVVDDEESIRLTFENFLVDEGYDVTTASEYNEALAIIEKVDFDLIFTDIILKGKTGINVLRDIKDKHINSLIIMITGAPDIKTASESVRLGAFDYMIKPVLQDNLLRVTNTALQQKKLIDENDKYRSNLEAIFKSVKDAIITVDMDLSVIEFNEAANNICYLSRKSIGEKLSYYAKHCNGRCVEALEETIRKKHTVEVYRNECRHTERPQQIMTITTYPLINSKGVFGGAVLVAKDETNLAGLEKEIKERQQFRNIIGKSKKMQEIYSLVENLADVQTTVLITGESGTGKELIADALHYSEGRNAKPLVRVNCAALSDNLLESELFGHVKGAFTGAINDRIGRFEMADGGTIFLDEIGDITPRMQAQLLRVLQERSFERMGDSRPVKVDVRVVAATRQDLIEKIKHGEFREDLYYRFKVMEIRLPALRDRKEDIPQLVSYFVDKLNKKLNKEIKGVSADVQDVFMDCSWPGNVRELENTMEHAFILCRNKTITLDHLPPSFGEFEEAKPSSFRDPKANERIKILQALEKSLWNKTKAADLLGMSRRNLYRKINEHNIKMLYNAE